MMARLLFLIFLVFILPLGTLSAQLPDNNLENQINNMYNRLVGAQDDQKYLINDSILSIMDNYAASDSVFDHKFTGLRFLGQILSPDKKIKIITWNIMETQGKNSYYCYFIKKEGKTNSIYKLTGIHKEESISNDSQYTTNNWYGALYYDIQPFKIKGEVMYMILGYDYHVLGISRKIIDILTFTDNGELQLGKDVLEKDDKKIFREVIEYSSEGIVSLRFNSKKQVIFDHLTSFSDTEKNSPEYQGSDLSFDAFIFGKGVWKFYTNIDVRNQD